VLERDDDNDDDMSIKYNSFIAHHFKICFLEFKSMAKPEIKIKAPRSEDSCGMEKMMKLF